MTSTDVLQAPHADAGLTPDDLRAMYYFMALTRALDERVRSLYLQGKLVGGVYTSRGQEGTAVASAYAMQPQDVCAPMIRDLGASIVRGVSPRAIFAQWLGRSGGPTGGRDANLHFGDLKHGVLAPISMLGATIPLCAGVALAARQRGKDTVALAYIGDGGSNTGDFHEGMNFAAALHLPLVVIVENNGYAYSTPVSQHVAIESFADRAAAYGIPGVSIEGNDVIEVYRTTRAALERARQDDGPSLIEARTFRMRGHAEHDDAYYVPKELVASWAQRDPLNNLRRYMEEHGLWTPQDEGSMDQRISREIEESLEWALSSPLPDPATQATGIYAE